MPDQTDAIPQPLPTPTRHWMPRVLVVLVALAMGGCVLGLLTWKAVAARHETLARSEVDITNLTRSLAKQAAHIIQSADVAMIGMAQLLKFQTPRSDRFNQFLAQTVDDLPQLREVGVYDVNGNWKYSSRGVLPDYSNADRDYFIEHKTDPDRALHISAPLKSRLTGLWSIILSRRIDDANGKFAGVVFASISVDYWDSIYRTMQLGEDGAVLLARADGPVLARWPRSDAVPDLANSELFQIKIKQQAAGFYPCTSLFDGLTKYIGYEKVSEYPIVVVVAKSEDQILAGWRRDLRADLWVALALMGAVIVMAMLLAAQFERRLRTETALRDRERRYRLLADHIADIVILLDRKGIVRYVSQSVQTVMGRNVEELVGQSCFDLVHPDDALALRQAGTKFVGASLSQTMIFRSYRADGGEIWIEANFKRAGRASDAPFEIVGVLRDVTERKRLSDELKSLNTRLGELATTDSLTGLANRRTVDGFLEREFKACERIAVIMLDIDRFKQYNDSFGHQAGDLCLASVARVIAEATDLTKGISARYGGEEFIIVLPGQSEEMAFIVAESVRLKIRALAIAHPSNDGGVLTISAGVAGKTMTTPSDVALVGEADHALYEAKRLGRDRTVRRKAGVHLAAVERV